MSIPILLVDDEIDFIKTFKKEAENYQIQTIFKTNYRAMEQYLPLVAGKIACIILDIKCLIDENSSAPREDFLTKSLRLLDQKYPDIPRFVLTGDISGYEYVNKFYSTNEKVFKKSVKDMQNLFQEIHKLDFEKIKIRSRYSSVFSIIDTGTLPDETEVQLIDLLSNQESDDYVKIVDNLAKIRRLQESIFQSLVIERQDLIPNNSIANDESIGFGKMHAHLQGNPDKNNNYRPTSQCFYTAATANLSNMIYRVTSDFGSHNPTERSESRPTKYTVIACTNALLELILWFGQLIRKGN